MDTDLMNTPPQVEKVWLTNNLPFAFTDRYDGIPIMVARGESKELTPDEAAHLFGYDPDPAAQLRHMAKRQGWNTPEFVKVNETTGKTKAQEYFAALEIKRVAYKLVPVDDADPRQPIPADPEVASKHKPSSKQKTA